MSSEVVDGGCVLLPSIEKPLAGRGKTENIVRGKMPKDINYQLGWKVHNEFMFVCMLDVSIPSTYP